MLTRDVLQSNEALSGLTDEQLEAIVTLSKNDEDQVIGTRIGEVYRKMDETIETNLGVKRDGDEKTYKFLERAAKIVAAQRNDLQGKVADLEKTIAEGSGDEQTKQELVQVKADLEKVRKEYADLQTKSTKAVAEHAKELLAIRVSHELDTAATDLRIKADIPESVAKMIMEQALSKVKAMNPDYIDAGDGKRVLVFKDAEGAILRNKENQLNPYTAVELVRNELKALDVLAENIQRTGAGGNGGGQHNGSSTSGVVITATTKRQANEAIRTALLAQGLKEFSSEYQEKFTAAWKENNVSSLPQ